MICIIYIVLLLLFMVIDDVNYDDLHHLYRHVFVVRGDR